jgi:probable rRNA maturation factor
MIVNRQSGVSIPLHDLEKFLTRTRRRLRLPKDAVTICLVTDAQIARWNRAYRGKKKPTDVLSFPANGSDSKRSRANQTRQRFATVPTTATESTSYLGDIAIAPAVAKRNARGLGRSFADEMRILILHGMLHLMGYDHEADQGQMDRREKRLHRELGLA